MERIDHTGERYGHLVVQEMIYEKRNNRTKTFCKCKCDCGNECIKQLDNIRRKTITPPHCGCKTEEYRSMRGELHRKYDIVGQKFGHLTVIEVLFCYSKYKEAYCRCLCECGQECVKRARDLTNPRGNPPHCGCMASYYSAKQGEKIRKDLTGQRFGRLVVLEMIYETNKHTLVRCKCDCGNEIVRPATYLTVGDTTSCGCYHSERTIESNTVDASGYVSDYGIKIIAPTRQNSHGAWLYDCECRCGNHFEALPACIKAGTTASCGCEVMSSLEQRTSFILDNMELEYEQQKTFPDCKYKNLLRFDFFIPDFNTLIECQGAQHYKPVALFGGEKTFKEQQIRDDIKKEYCKLNNYNFVEIPYYLDDSEIKAEISNAIYP